MQEWVAKRQRLGLWRDQTANTSSSSIATTTPPSHHPISMEALQASFDRMSINATALSSQPTKPDNLESPTALMANSWPNQSTVSLIYTGATHQIFANQSMFDNKTYKDISSCGETLNMAGGPSTLPIVGRGTVTFQGPNGDVFCLTDCLHIPNLCQSLIGGTQLLRSGFTTTLELPTTFKVAWGPQVAFSGTISPTSNLLFVKVRHHSFPTATLLKLTPTSSTTNG